MGRAIIINGADFSQVAVEQISLINGIYITAITSQEGGGVVNGSGEYEEGDSVTLTAIPNDGYVFDSWTDGTSTAQRTITVGSTPAVYVATFREIEPISLDINAIKAAATDWSISDGKWLNSATFTSTLVDIQSYVSIYTKVEFVNNASGRMDIAFLTSNTQVNYETPDYATGWDNKLIINDDKKTVDIPSDARYIYIAITATAIDRTPTSITLI